MVHAVCDAMFSMAQSKPAVGRKVPGPSIPHGGTTVLSERTLPLGQKLTVIKGSILDVKADAYVHPTNASFNLGGQVGELSRGLWEVEVVGVVSGNGMLVV